MKLTVALPDCLKALDPVLTEMTKGASDNDLLFTATDSQIQFTIHKSEITWTSKINATITIPGTFIVPLKPFIDFLRSVKGESLLLQTKQDKLYATCQKTKITFNPSIDTALIQGPMSPERYIPLATLTSHALDTMLQATIPLIASDRSPQIQYRCSIWTITPTPKPTLTIQATDTLRIFQWTNPITIHSETQNEPITLYLPASTTRLLLACLKQTPPESTFTFMPQNSSATFQIESTSITTRLLQYTFAKNLPIPQPSTEPTYELPKDHFLHLLRCAKLTTGKDAYRINIGQKNQDIQISAENPGIANSHHTLYPITSKAPFPSQLFVNPDFLLDACYPIPTKTFHLTIKGEQDPLLLSTPEHQGFYHLIAPIKG